MRVRLTCIQQLVVHRTIPAGIRSQCGRDLEPYAIYTNTQRTTTYGQFDPQLHATYIGERVLNHITHSNNHTSHFMPRCNLRCHSIPIHPSRYNHILESCAKSPLCRTQSRVTAIRATRHSERSARVKWRQDTAGLQEHNSSNTTKLTNIFSFHHHINLTGGLCRSNRTQTIH